MVHPYRQSFLTVLLIYDDEKWSKLIILKLSLYQFLSAPQCHRMDLNKKSRPKPKTTSD